ncbi:cadmium-translocating P-type ATPase [Acetobacteraceae bacterium H6797]|nr:cadmium-translocating P-type ATPase [Acetobacteraceae bacterium H6797]
MALDKAQAAAGPAPLKYRVSGMDCAGCAAKIDRAVRRVPGVTEVNVSVSAGTLTVDHDASAQPGAAIEKTVADLGYGLTAAAPANRPAEAHGHGHAHDHAHGHDHTPHEGTWWSNPKLRLTAASGIAFAIAWLLAQAVPQAATWLYVAAVLVGLVPIARRAFAAARHGSPFTIEMLMTIAAIGAIVIGASEEAAAVVFLFLVGELLEGFAAGRARASIQGLINLVPKTALREEGGETREVPAASLAPGDIILIRPGDRVPADGMVLSGESSVDEAPVTGESAPRRKAPGDTLFAGTINQEAALRLTVTAGAQDNTIARIVRLVEQAQEAKAPTERFIDRFSRYYTPSVVVVAALVAILPPLLAGGDWGEWVYKGLAILLIGCPCALVISTPAAIAAALSSGARRGLLMKGGAVLEQAGHVTAVAFDKTGTLTAGKPRVTDIAGFARSEAEVLALAAALEAGSSHPLATAILNRASEAGLRPAVAAGAAAVPGQGVRGLVGGEMVFLGSVEAAAGRAALSETEAARIADWQAEGKSVSVLVAGGRIAGAIAMRDEPREDAAEGLRALDALGVKAVMLTGDNPTTAKAIAASLGIEARAGLLPEDKQCIVKELQSGGAVVAKVGDGINDAPALAAADIGIAMGGGTDVALETADAAVLHGRVKDVAAMIGLSRSTMANIKQNITIALGLKAVFLVTTVMGITGLWPAILADTGATVLVTANALRLLRR